MFTDDHLWYALFSYLLRKSSTDIYGMPCFHIYLESVHRWPSVVCFVFELFLYLPWKSPQKDIYGMLCLNIFLLLWVHIDFRYSLLWRPTPSGFTRVQRLSCCLSLLFTTMIANAMWYQTSDETSHSDVMKVGPLSFSSQVKESSNRWLCYLIMCMIWFIVKYNLHGTKCW